MKIISVCLFLLSALYFYKFTLLLLCLYLSINVENYIYKIKLYHFSRVSEIDKMTGLEFEERMYNYFKRAGFKVNKTKISNDFGCDLILTKNNEVTVVQTKRWISKIGVKAVQEVCAAIKHYNADYGMLITNSSLTVNARKLAASNNIYIWERSDLIYKLGSNSINSEIF